MPLKCNGCTLRFERKSNGFDSCKRYHHRVGEFGYLEATNFRGGVVAAH